MGNAQVMTAKVAWDNACYWGITARLFFQRRLRQPEFIASIDPLMRRFFVLHARMQQFLKAWYTADGATSYEAAAPNVVDVGFLRHLQASLGDPIMNDEELRRRLDDNYALLEAFARTWQAIATEHHPALARVVPTTGDLLDVGNLELRALADETSHHNRRVVPAEA